jgi:hypothetical protein
MIYSPKGRGGVSQSNACKLVEGLTPNVHGRNSSTGGDSKRPPRLANALDDGSRKVRLSRARTAGKKHIFSVDCPPQYSTLDFVEGVLLRDTSHNGIRIWTQIYSLHEIRDNDVGATTEHELFVP